MSKHLYSILLLFTIFSLSTSCSAEAAPKKWHKGIQRYFNDDWSLNAHWDDGLGEVAIYEATRKVYGESREFEYVFITVKETFNKQYNVKTLDYERKGLFDVMKQNKFCSIPTQEYPYHYLSSLWFRRGIPYGLHKFTNSSQEWCGQTFKNFRFKPAKIIYNYDSYWDEEGRGKRTAKNKALFEDQLSYTLRTLKFEDGLTFEYMVFPTQITNKATPLKAYNANIMVADFYDEGWKVIVEIEGLGTNQYLFEKEYPNVLLSATTWDGSTLKLKEISRYDYWNVE